MVMSIWLLPLAMSSFAPAAADPDGPAEDGDGAAAAGVESTEAVGVGALVAGADAAVVELGDCDGPACGELPQAASVRARPKSTPVRSGVTEFSLGTVTRSSDESRLRIS